MASEPRRIKRYESPVRNDRERKEGRRPKRSSSHSTSPNRMEERRIDSDRRNRPRDEYSRQRIVDRRDFSDYRRGRSPIRGGRSRSRSPGRDNDKWNGHRDTPRERSAHKYPDVPAERNYKRDDISGEEDIEEENDEMERMKQMMGISSFGSTKGKKVQADVSGVFKPKKSNYRQYMNRERGFNRPLSPPPAEKPRHSRDLTPGN